jgi:DNA-binding beta-propeller fold protein YncE
VVLPLQNQSAIQQIGCTFASRCPLGRTWVCTQTIDPEAHRLFSSCENNVLVVIDADAGTIVATLPIGARSDGAAFDPKRKLIFSSNGDGTLSVIVEKDANSFATVASVATKRGARTMTLDPETGRLYLVAADTTINPSADPSDLRHRYVVTPGSAQLLILDPMP